MSRTITNFDKYADEILDQSVDFVDVLGGGESISSAEVVAYDSVGADATATVISGSAAINSTAIEYTVYQGAVGAYYWIDVKATLNTSELLVHRLKMTVPNP